MYILYNVSNFTILLGFLKPVIGLLMTALLIFCCIEFNKSFTFLNNEATNKTKLFDGSIKYFFICITLVGIWVYFSGIGGFSYQNDDYIVRNAMFRDLINYKWPIIFDITDLNSLINRSTNSSQVALVYYFTFWLPAAIFGKAFGVLAANYFLFMWTVLGVTLIIYTINRYVQRRTYIVLFMLLAFSGLDVLGCLILKRVPIDLITHVEWWAGIFQYSSNTTLLYWVFNQALPTWLITMLVLNGKNSRNVAFIGSATFCYSPFATFGVIPFVIYSLINGEIGQKQTLIQRFKQSITLQNLIFPICILIVYGSFYISNQMSLNVSGFILSEEIINPNSLIKTSIPNLVLLGIIGIFAFCEVGVYLLLLYKEMVVERNGYLLVAAAELLLIPFYYMTLCNDFVMRASIPALFVLMIMLTRHIIYNKGLGSILIVGSILVGFYTPICEMNRSVNNTFVMDKNKYDYLYSMKDILIKDNEILHTYNLTEKMILLDKAQYFSYEYKKNFFFKILSE